MSFKYFRPTVRKVTTTQKAPAFKNTASAERFADLLDASDILTNHSVEKHLAEVNFDDHGHSILKESGLTRGHSIIETSFGDQLAGSILGDFGKHNEPQFGEDGLRSAVGFAKGMAGKGGSDSGSGQGMTFTAEEVAAFDAGYEEGMNDSGVDAYTEGYQDGLARGETSDNAEQSNQNTPTEGGAKDADVNNSQQQEVNKHIVGAVCGWGLMKVGAGLPGWTILTMCTGYKVGKDLGWFRPGPDDDGGSEGGFMTWKMQDQLSNGFKNAKDPITNPYNENQGGGVLTATELQEMEADLRNAKDPATNWGDDNYNNFVGTIEMNVGQISLKETATNWGDNYASTTTNVVDTVFATVQDF